MKELTVTQMQCWKVVETVNGPYHLFFVSCSNVAYCTTTYKICVYYDESGAHIRKEFDRSSWWPGEGCNLIGIPDIPVYPPGGYWESDCFTLPNYCN